MSCTVFAVLSVSAEEKWAFADIVWEISVKNGVSVELNKYLPKCVYDALNTHSHFVNSDVCVS